MPFWALREVCWLKAESDEQKRREKRKMSWKRACEKIQQQEVRQQTKGKEDGGSRRVRAG